MRKQQRTKAHPSKMKSAITEHVARRLREERVRHGLSQTDLGKRLGVSFQQVQKYEKGTNRLSAAALYLVARELNVPLLSFFPSDENPLPIVRPRLELELCRHFGGLSEPLQGTVYGLIKRLDARHHGADGAERQGASEFPAVR
jgi:transcriptional regulator with XRE-family HTH domain